MVIYINHFPISLYASKNIFIMKSVYIYYNFLWHSDIQHLQSHLFHCETSD